MKALSDRSDSMSNKNNFDVLKKERRFNIVNAIRNLDRNATIKDIHTEINKDLHGMSFCSEKTLQRELVSMIKDDVLKKTGEKRWSRYSLK